MTRRYPATTGDEASGASPKKYNEPKTNELRPSYQEADDALTAPAWTVTEDGGLTRSEIVIVVVCRLRFPGL
jgi:hypothetical protein